MNKMISEEVKYNGKRFNVVQRVYQNKDGKEYIRDCVDTRSASVVLAIDENEDVLFVRQYREVIGKETLELPAGIIDENEEPIDTAKRELEEETGFIARKIEYLGEFYSTCGFVNEKIYIFYASELIIGKAKQDDDEEINSVIQIPLKKCYEMLAKNEFEHASQIVALTLYYFKKMNKI